MGGHFWGEIPPPPKKKIDNTTWLGAGQSGSCPRRLDVTNLRFSRRLKSKLSVPQREESLFSTLGFGGKPLCLIGAIKNLEM
jgi:hypothetical protein